MAEYSLYLGIVRLGRIRVLVKGRKFAAIQKSRDPGIAFMTPPPAYGVIASGSSWTYGF